MIHTKLELKLPAGPRIFFESKRIDLDGYFLCTWHKPQGIIILAIYISNGN